MERALIFDMPGVLYILGTPIGNLKDLTFRAVENLASVAAVVCEDTRVTSKLLAAYHISKPLISLHEHTSEHKLAQLIERLKRGDNLAYVVDAGTPGMNDPGGKFVAAAMAAGIHVVPIPGISALTTAISVCGFPMDEFLYLGFIPHKKGRQTFFRSMAQSIRPVVLLESTHRILKTLEALVTTLEAQRLVFVGRELTKLHETLYRGTAQAVHEEILHSSIKGEFILIVGPRPKRYTVSS